MTNNEDQALNNTACGDPVEGGQVHPESAMPSRVSEQADERRAKFDAWYARQPMPDLLARMDPQQAAFNAWQAATQQAAPASLAWAIIRDDKMLLWADSEMDVIKKRAIHPKTYEGGEIVPIGPIRAHQAAPEWTYCPECGSSEIRHEEGSHKQCAACHQEWWSDVDYSDIVQKHLGEWKGKQAAPEAPTHESAHGNTTPAPWAVWEGRNVIHETEGQVCVCETTEDAALIVSLRNAAPTIVSPAATTASASGECCDVCKGTGYFYEDDPEVGQVARECEVCAPAPSHEAAPVAGEGLAALDALARQLARIHLSCRSNAPKLDVRDMLTAMRRMDEWKMLHALLAAPTLNYPAVPEGWVIALQAAVEIPGARPELGYTILDNTAIFPTEKGAMEAIQEVGLPLGWVVMSLRQLLPDLGAAS